MLTRQQDHWLTFPRGDTGQVFGDFLGQDVVEHKGDQLVFSLLLPVRGGLGVGSCVLPGAELHTVNNMHIKAAPIWNRYRNLFSIPMGFHLKTSSPEPPINYMAAFFTRFTLSRY